MKNKTLVSLLLIIIACLAIGCSSEFDEVKEPLHSAKSTDTTNDSANVQDNLSESNAPDTSITTIQELRRVVESAHISEKGNYNAVLSFLTGDSEALAKYANVDPACFRGLDTVIISDFKLEASKEKRSCLEFTFTVKESDYPSFPPGQYGYYIDDSPICWHSYDEVNLSEYSDNLDIIMNILPSAVLTFENPTSNVYDENFDIFAPYFIMQMENFHHYGTSTNEETLSRRMEEFFGVEEFDPDDKYYEIVDGVYRINDNVRELGLSVAHRVVDVRKVDTNIIEVEVCFFADKATLCMTNKTTYTFEKGDFAYGYKLLNAKTIEITSCETLRFSN